MKEQILREMIELCRVMLFPEFYKEEQSALNSDMLRLRLKALPVDEAIADEFIASLPELQRLLATDVQAHYNNDPAAHSLEEVILCYPGLKAIMHYRIAHRLVQLGVPLIPRMITEQAHAMTGIDINPEAQIGESFAIDHGTGVVIGATCVIGNNVTIYQGVTLGARNFPKNSDGTLVKGTARHPMLGDGVIVYANATLLGRITIGEKSVIGGNVWLTHDVPAGSTIVQREG